MAKGSGCLKACVQCASRDRQDRVCKCKYIHMTVMCDGYLWRPISVIAMACVCLTAV